MTMFSVHLAEVPPVTTLRAIARPPSPATTPGLLHAECLAGMELGSPVLSPARFRAGQLVIFAAWESASALDAFLDTTSLGRRLADAWHVRLDFVRRWGVISELPDLPLEAGRVDPGEPVAAVTLARLRHTQIPRFIRWGKPVERLVRDHPGQTLALAATHPVRTVSTFTVWRTEADMLDMVAGHGAPADRRHADAMIERERKDFHIEFTTLRFRVTSEHGTWKGRRGIVPTVASG